MPETELSVKTVQDLRAILSDEIKRIRTGETTPANVNAITNAAGKILSSVKLEIEYNKLLGQVPVIDFIKTGKTAKRVTEK